MTPEAQREKWRLAKRAQYAKRIALGLCCDCSAPVTAGYRRCKGCLESSKLYQNSRTPRKTPPQPGVDKDDRWSAADFKMAEAGRCERCRLLKPCVCLPTIEEVAASRSGESAGEAT